MCIRYCYSFLFLLTVTFCISQEKIILTTSFESVESVPVYPGCFPEKEKDRRKCFQEKIQRHISRNFRYPEFAQKKGIQGRVFVQFIIGTGGYVEQIRARGPDPILETEAKRIISLIPKLTPGRVDGKAVRVPFSVPITFRLAGKKTFNN